MVIGIEGSGFLWNMVRIIVGTLVQVGIGRYTPRRHPGNAHRQASAGVGANRAAAWALSAMDPHEAAPAGRR